jgi:hypothetical protein
MRTAILTGLLASALMMGGCLNADSLIGPSTGSDGGASAAAATREEIRIVEPRHGELRMAGEEFLVRAYQELRDGPVQGRGQLQASWDGGDWVDCGPAFPWTRQSHEIEAMAAGIDELGVVHLRLIVYEDHPELPFLESAAVSLRCVPVQSVEVASK